MQQSIRFSPLMGFIARLAALSCLVLLPAVPGIYGADEAWHSCRGPEGGQVTALAVDPQSPAILYAGTAGGVFRSSDGGASWSAVNSGLTNTNISALAIDPQSPATVYAGTPDGIFKTTNGGNNWNAVNSGLANPYIAQIGALAIDPQNPATVYALAGNYSGVFKSTNGGASWSFSDRGLPDIWITGLAIDPQNPATLYVGTFGESGGVYKSTDGGVNWNSANGGLTSTDIRVLAIDPQSPATVYAGTESGVFKSIDGGASWSEINNGLYPTTITAMAIDPQTPETVYAGREYGDIFKSTNGGADWSPVYQGLSNNSVQAIAIDPQSPATVYAGRISGGVIKSTSGGANWIATNGGLTNTYIQALAIDPQIPATVYAGTSGSGVFKSIDGGASWSDINRGLLNDFSFMDDVEALAVDPQNPSTVYAGMYYGGIYKSTDGGANWNATGFAQPSLMDLAIDPQNPATLYAGTQDIGVFKSIDGGANWVAVNNGLTSTLTQVLAIDPQNPSTVYVGMNTGGVFKSTNGGASWSPVNNGLLLNPIEALVIDPQNPETLYAATFGSGVFKSTNGGASWNPISSGFPSPDQYVRALAIDPDNPEILYAGMEVHGVFRSTNSGASWVAINTGLANKRIKALAIDPETPQRIYAGTSGSGVWAYGYAPLDLNLNSGGAVIANTPGDGDTTRVGYATLAVNSGTTPYGTAVFSLKQSGVTVTEAGVPASPPTTRARIFIEYRNSVNAIPARTDVGTVDVNTGIAVVNYGSTTANVTYTLRDIAGATLTIGHGTIGAGNHFACFIHELKGRAAPDFNLPADFQNTTQFGSLEMTSDQPLSVLGLRGTYNQRRDFLITTTPVADVTQPSSASPIYFPQFVDGGGYTTSLILLNASGETETGRLQIVDNEGDPFAVLAVGGTSGSVFEYSIEPDGVYRIQTDGFPTEVKVGWVRLIPDEGSATPIGSGVFGFNPHDTLVSESGIPSADSTTHARVYVDLSGKHNTGLAIANVADTSANITIRAFQSDGVTEIGTSQGPLELDARGHGAAFANEFISGLPAGFTGVLDISSETPFAALTLRSLYNERDDFMMTTFPVADANKTAPSPIVFPQVVDGGGYITQFILISPTDGASTTLHFYAEDGTPWHIE